MRKPWLGVAMLVAMWGFALAVLGRLPAEVPSHWNLQGEADAWMPRMPGAFIAPIIATGVWALLHALPWLDPRRRNVEHNRGDRSLIANLIVLFCALLEGVTLGAALGWPVAAAGWVQAGLGLLLIGIGNYLPRIRSNWWIGIRTPWTLDSERVWRETHRVGGRAFVAGGVLLVAAALLPAPVREWVTMAVLVPMVVLPIAYSFVAWRREGAGHPLNGSRP